MSKLDEIGMEIHNCWDRKLEKPVWVVNSNGDLGVYNKHDWLVEQKEAYELYADKIF